MSVDAAKQFYQQAENDDDLLAKLEELEGEFDKIVALGAERGFTFTAEEFEQVYDEATEVSLDTLEKSAGGLGGLKPRIDLDTD